MKKRLPFVLLGLIAIGVGVFLYMRAEKIEQLSFTGFVEGEEKVIKSEISGRVETVAFRAPYAYTVQTRLIRAGEYVNPGTGITALL